MAKVANIFVSVVHVVDMHVQQPVATIQRLSKDLSKRYANYEIVIIDNGVVPEVRQAIRELLPVTPCIRVVRLSKVYDTDTAIFAGVEASIGDYTCILYNDDPAALVPDFISKTQEYDIVFGIANNLSRQTGLEQVGARLFYWYSQRYLHITVPNNSTYFICMNRSAANALTRSGRFMRHIRHMAQRVGFSSTTLDYTLPPEALPYSHAKTSALASRAVDLISNYSSHPLRVLSYFGIVAGLLNIVYAIYVVIVNLASNNVAKGWTTLSLQSSLMFFILFIILAVLAEYVGKILNETQQEPPYHIMQELSSTISIADATRRNVTK